jgi:hypothetical protein
MPIELSLAVTDLASLCRMDHYNNFARIVCKYWKKLNPEHYATYYNNQYKKGKFAANDTDKQKILLLNSKLNSTMNIGLELNKINKYKNNTNELKIKIIISYIVVLI